jgi:FkbM family methyltransferase
MLGGLKARAMALNPAWRHSHAALIDHLTRLAPELRFDGGDDPSATLDDGAVRLFGFWSDDEALALHASLPANLRHAIPAPHFRLARDVLTRFAYPHMRPDLKPEGYAAAQMTGFHGQHKDAIADLPDAAERETLLRAFRPKPGETILDGGAFIGFGALAMLRASTGARIIAVEAASACVRLLRRNLAENGAEGAIVPVNAALWSEVGQRDLKREFAQAASLLDDVVPNGRDETVETTTIDRLVEQFEIGRLDMLSLTINGAEASALEGARATLERLRPRIRLAGWYRLDGIQVATRAASLLENAGYRVFVGLRGNVMALPEEAT